MKTLYSTYEAKAKLSEILRQVRSGRIIQISHRGTPVAEIRPIQQGAGDFEKRVQELSNRSAVARSRQTERQFRPVERKPGALQRFLGERNR